jgi:PAS domain S-box-containing protein
MTEFGSRLKSLRKEINLSQAELANKFGYSRSTIANYEQNVRLPSIKILVKMADYFDVSVDYLLGRSNIRTTFRNYFEKNSVCNLLLVNPKTGKIIDYNPSALSYYGYTKEKLLSKSIFDINILSNDKIRDKMDKAIAEKMKVFHTKHQLSNGQIRDVEITVNLITAGIKPFLAVIVTDLSHLNNSEKDCKESLDDFFDSMSEIISYSIPYKKNTPVM